MRPDTPHFAYPFRLNANGRSARVTEQDSDDEIIDCVEVVLSTHRGERLDEPDMGLEEFAFRENGVDVNEITSVLSVWEPRASTTIEAGDIIDLAQQVSIGVQGRDDG